MIKGVTQLEITGAGDITIKSDGTIKGAVEVEKKGNKLIVRGKASSGSVIITSGGSQIITGSVVTNDIVFHNGRNSAIGRIVGNVGDGGTVVINGSSVKNEKTKDFFIDPECRIEKVKVSGSAYVGPLPNKLVTDDFSVVLSGGGTVVLPARHFEKLSVKVTGSGDAIGENATSANKVKISLCGSGDINGIHIRDTGIVSLTGSGDIRLSATNPKEIMKNKVGSGSIKIKKK